MQYRKFGTIDFNVSALGFGCMRLPIIGDDSSKIDEEEAIKMIRYGIDEGINFVDTAYPYHGGNSEPVVGKALQDGYREKVKLSTKLPVWLVENSDDYDRLLDEQLTKLQTDHIDFYLMHGLTWERWPKLKELKLLQKAEKAKADGRIKHICFSFHDTLDLFKEIVDGYDDWAMCLVQHNYMNEDFQAGSEGVAYAASKGIAVAIMEPLMGGGLINPSPEVMEVFQSAPVQRAPADWALQWLWNKPEVGVVVSGMSAMQHVKENLASAEKSGIGTLSAEELEIIAKAQKAYEGLQPIPCTKCGYCMPCPHGLDIPRNLELYNQDIIFKQPQPARFNYQRRFPDEIKAENCTQCRECEEKCPQHIEISEWMPKVHEELSKPL